MIAALLLALCALPAASAVKNALAASDLAQTRMREMRCLQSAMESVLAQPYITLWQAARGTQQTTAFSQPADAACVQRDVYIVKYQALYGKTPVFLPYPDQDTEQHLEDVLLYVTVSSPDSSYSFTTLVAR